MTDLEDARRRWLRDKPKFEQLGNEFARILKQEISHEGLWADVTSRAKEIDSLIRKLILKPYYSYESIGDKAGVRAIVRFKDEINLVLEIAARIFDLSNVENTAGRLKPDSVGYLSVHGAIRFNARDFRATEYPPEQFAAELQVRTLAQHLWAEITHDSVYKNDETLQPLSGQLKRRVYILAGAVELVDEEFNRIEKETPSVPEADVLKALERYHFRLAARRGDSEISLNVIRLLLPLYRMDARRIIARFADFYGRHADILREVYARASETPERSAFLFQPEALMIYDLLELDPLSIRRVWNEHYPERELERIANVFGISFY